MAELIEDKNRHRMLGDIQEYPVLESAVMFEGSVVGLTGGYARSYVDGDLFVGFCEQRVDSYGRASGDLEVRVLTRGTFVLDVVDVVDETTVDVGHPVYTGDGVEFTSLDAIGTKVGHIYRYISPGVCEVRFDPINKPEVETVLTFPINLADLVSSSSTVDYFNAPFNGRIKRTFFLVNTPTISVLKAANPFVVTDRMGGDFGGKIRLKSDNCTPMGNVVEGGIVTCCSGIKEGELMRISTFFINEFTSGSGSFNIVLGH